MTNTISYWYGRLGNNIQQISNGILFSEINNRGFISPPHEFINEVKFNYDVQSPIISNRFFHYNTHNKDFDIDLNYLYSNIRRICREYIFPNFKFTVDESFGNNILVIHVRSGDTFQIEFNPPHAYTPNPLSYYVSLVELFEKVIVVTENDDYNPIVSELKKYKNVTIQSTDIANDFSTLMRAKNLASSGTGTFSVAAALCSPNIQNFYCSNVYLDEHLNPEMIKSSSINVSMITLKNYLTHYTWKNDEQQRKFILEYDHKIFDI